MACSDLRGLFARNLCLKQEFVEVTQLVWVRLLKVDLKLARDLESNGLPAET
jgi:hypothetical protein